jgi:hypothetical protein
MDSLERPGWHHRPADPHVRQTGKAQRRFVLVVVLVLVLESGYVEWWSVGVVDMRELPTQRRGKPKPSRTRTSTTRTKPYGLAVPQCNDTVPQVSDPEG